jgi:hypothetical protein
MADGTVSTSAAPPAPALAPAPSWVDLRPLSTSELIDRGFSLYRAHFAGFLLLALLCQSAPLLSQILATLLKLNPSQEQALRDPTGFFERLGILCAISFVAQLIVFSFEVVITYYIADAYLGKDPSVKTSLRRFTSCFLPSVWTCVLNRILIGITFLFPFVVVTAAYLYLLFHPPLTLTPLIVVGIVTGVFFIISLAPVLIVFMRLMVTIPALALEGLSGWKAVRRSAALVQYDPGLGILYWGEMRLSFLLLPLFIIELMILSLTSLPLTIHQIGEIIRNGSTGQIAPPPDLIMVLSQILTFLAGSLILPLYSIATTLFYYDIRIRREGFDLEFMANRLRSRT